MTSSRPGQWTNIIYYAFAAVAWCAAILHFEHDSALDWVNVFSLDLFDAELYFVIASLVTALLAASTGRFLSRFAVPGGLSFTLLAAVAFFASFVVLIEFFGQDGDGLPAVYVTPVFVLVIGVYLAVRRGWGVAQLVIFSFAVNFAHLFATDWAAFVYDQGWLGDEIHALFVQIGFVKGDETGNYFEAGLVGGVVGSGLSFLALALAASNLRKHISVLAYLTVLGVIGAVGLAAIHEHFAITNNSEPEWLAYVWLYPPWQIVFGIAIIDLTNRSK